MQNENFLRLFIFEVILFAGFQHCFPNFEIFKKLQGKNNQKFSKFLNFNVKNDLNSCYPCIKPHSFGDKYS